MALQTEEIKKIYGGYSGAYDFIFKSFFYAAQVSESVVDDYDFHLALISFLNT